MKSLKINNTRVTFKEALIFYFSGTGNAQQTAYWIADTLRQARIKTRLINIAAHRGEKITIPETTDLIGICSPTHGFHFPEITRNFIRKLPATTRTKAFVINTRAGLRIGTIFLPGLSGLAHYMTVFRLRIKGYALVGLRPVDLPSNWISLHPAVRQPGIERMVSRQERKVRVFTENISSGKKDFRALRDMVQDLLIVPVAIGYVVVGRFFIAKSFYASHACTACGKCLRSCPVKAIKKVQGRMFWTYRCESCMQCMNQCPEKAIQTAHGFFFLFFYLFTTFLSGTLLAALVKVFPGMNWMWLNSGFWQLIADSFFMLALLLLAYRGMHWFLRFRWFERLMVWTSLTSYKIWGRYTLGVNKHKIGDTP